MKNFRLFFFVFVLVMAVATILIGANTGQRVMNKGSSQITSTVPYAETNVVNVNFAKSSGDQMIEISPQNFAFTSYSTAKTHEPMVRRNFSSLNATCTRMLTNTLETQKATGGAEKVIKKVNSGLSVNTNPFTVYLLRPAMVLKLPMTTSLSIMDFVMVTGTYNTMQNSSTKTPAEI